MFLHNLQTEELSLLSGVPWLEFSENQGYVRRAKGSHAYGPL